MKLVLIESPYKGDVEKNVRYARAAMKDCFDRGEAPFASALLYTQEGVLDDTVNEDRFKGIHAGLCWGMHAEASVVYNDLGITVGMKLGLQRAQLVGRPVEYRTLEGWSTDGE